MLIFGCNNYQTSPTTVSSDTSPLNLTMSLPSSKIKANVTYKIKVTVKNVSSKNAEFIIFLNIVVFDKDQKTVFNWVENIMFGGGKGVGPSPAMNEILKPGESYSEYLELKVDKKGTFSIRAQNDSVPKLETESTKITVTD